MNEHDTMVIRNLTGSYCRRVETYDALCGVVEKILGRLVLSRGDFAGVKADFEEKKQLLDQIEMERAAMSGDVETWRERKSILSGEKEACEFDQVLVKVEAAIRKFLEVEGQLKRYIEQRMQVHSGDIASSLKENRP